MLASFPLFLISFAIYNMVAFLMPSLAHAESGARRV